MCERLVLKHSLCFPEPVSRQVLAASSVVRSAYSKPFGSASKSFGIPLVLLRRILNNAYEVTIQSQVAAKNNNTFQLHHQITLSLYVVHLIAFHD